ncbi:MAG: hypothetical protein U1E76_05155 [Planctomycetota bacterium]
MAIGWFGVRLVMSAPAGPRSRSPRYSSWKLDSSSTARSFAVERSTSPSSERPQLPPRNTPGRAAASMRASSVVVVVLPFEPVTPTMRPRK